MSGEYRNFSSFTRGYGGGRFKSDYCNRHYVRGRGVRGGGSTATPLSFPPDVNIKKGLDTSRIIETIHPPPHPSALEDIPIENVQYVASYSWVDTEQPTIVVPGSPAVWTGRSVPFTLQPDSDSHFIDRNGARMSEYPMLPLFAAADAIHGDKKAPVNWPAVDVITDRHGLRKLLRWLSPSVGREVRDFGRIDVELVGAKTIVLTRWERRPCEPPTSKSYGFGFEAATARAAPGCPRSGHHRAITYDMLDMKMVVRFEVDAFLPTPELAVDDLEDTPGNTTSASSAPPALNIIRAGTQIPQEALLEVTSRSKYFIDQLDWKELYPQLALSQTPGLRLGVHECGTFTELRECQVDSDDDAGAGMPPGLLRAQRRETAAQLVRLARVLEDLQELAIARGPGPAGSFSLVRERGELRAYGHSKGARMSCLPPDVWTLFARTGGSDADA